MKQGMTGWQWHVRVINFRTVLYCILMCCGKIFLSPEFGTKFQRELPLFLEIPLQHSLRCKVLYSPAGPARRLAKSPVNGSPRTCSLPAILAPKIAGLRTFVPASTRFRGPRVPIFLDPLILTGWQQWLSNAAVTGFMMEVSHYRWSGTHPDCRCACLCFFSRTS